MSKLERILAEVAEEIGQEIGQADLDRLEKLLDQLSTISGRVVDRMTSEADEGE